MFRIDAMEARMRVKADAMADIDSKPADAAQASAAADQCSPRLRPSWKPTGEISLLRYFFSDAPAARADDNAVQSEESREVVEATRERDSGRVVTPLSAAFLLGASLFKAAPSVAAKARSGAKGGDPAPPTDSSSVTRGKVAVNAASAIDPYQERPTPPQAQRAPESFAASDAAAPLWNYASDEERLVSVATVSSAPVIVSWSPDSVVVSDGIATASPLMLTSSDVASAVNTNSAVDGSGSSAVTTFVVPALANSASPPIASTVVIPAPPPPVLTSETVVNVNEVLLTGTAQSNSVITVYDNNVVVGTGVANASGVWSLTTAPLPAGAQILTATATDAAGHVSALSAPLDPVTGTPNAIVAENQKAGTPMSVWWVNPGQDSTNLEGFTTQMGTNVGGTVQFKIDNLTGNPNYTISIYRLGYYGGDGARLITTLNHTGTSVVVQPAALTNAATGEVDAGNWSVTDSWTVPADAVSGVYIANVTEGGQVFQIPFVISNPSDSSAIIFQTNDQTWQAYNGWGGADVYGGNGPGANGSAYAVSYNRPIVTRDAGTLETGRESGTSNDMVFSAEFPTIYWLEQNGYDVSYISGEQLATATSDAVLLNHQVYMDSGHDEYWTDQQYQNVLAAGQAGVNLMFLSGNEIYWQTRFGAGLTGDANRTMITYKDTHANTLIDPTGTATSSFMDARFASTGGLAGTPSNALTGQVFSVDSQRFDTITIPYGETQLRIWRDTSVANTAVGGTASLSPGLLGYEWDSSPDNGFMPAGLVDVSSTTLQVQTLLLDYGNTTGNGTATHNLVEFRDPVSGALVFSTGTVFWSWGLSDQHDFASGVLALVDPSVQQATVNVLADMGVQPQTLQASLVVASASTDHTAPTSNVSSISTSSPTEGQSVTVTGTATDVGGVIGGVQVSTDGGKTWHQAASSVGAATAIWSYTFAAGAAGSYTFESRAVDDSLNLETPNGGVTYTVAPTSNLTLFGTATPTATYLNDPNSVEVGLQFTSATTGVVTGVRFYKDASNTGTHFGDLWSSDGALLASATFTNETASGWQQVNFSAPVLIQAGQTYYASYHSNTGYSYTDFYFDNVGAGYSNGSLTATGNGLNGYYAYGSSSTFPNSVSFANGDNYWVDVVFNDANIPPVANNDGGFTTAENTALTISASQLLANDTDPNGLTISINGVSSPINGTVSFNSQTKIVTFTPTTGYTGPASFVYSITDAGGGIASATVSLAVTSPTATESLFSASSTPATLALKDPGAVELGVKFTSDANGKITGIRFYKGSSNTGTHTGDLWSSSGQLLATATFTNETASGWQQVNFSSPVAITAGATYVAAYHTSSGYYSATSNYFTANVVSGDLTAPASGNGVYAYSSSDVFPTNSYNATNYWVDVVYVAPAAQPPVANNDGGFTTVESVPLTIKATQLIANDTDPNGLTIILSGVSSPTNGTVNYNSQTQVVTFTPTTGYTGAASFTYTITDADGGTASANVSLTVNAPQPLVANNDSGFTTVENTALTINAAQLLANDTDPNGLTLSIAGVSTPVNGTVSYNSQTQVVTFTPATGYTGAASFTYTITDASGETASANASLTVKAQQPPVANNDSGFVAIENTTLTINASQLLANDTDPNGLALSISGVSNPVNGTVSYNAQTQVVTFTPTANYTGAASFTYTIADATNQTASATVSLTVDTATANESLFSASATPAILAVNDPSAVELGVKFTADANGEITGIRFYKGAANTGTHVGDLWSSTGQLLATATFANESASGWQQVSFSTPVSITAGTTYIAAYHTSSGNYSATANYFTSNVVSGDLTAPVAGNGVYAYGSSDLFPTNSFNATNYWVDVVYTPATLSQPVANNDSGFVTAENTPLTITASQLLANDTDPNGLALSISGVSNPQGGTVSYDSTTQTVTFTPTTGYTGLASFTYAIKDTAGGVASATVSATVTSPAGTESLFASTWVPAVATVQDANAVNLGVKFTSSQAGEITGISFYKGPQNTGTHVASLWSSTGSLLASATFTNETASGWQQVTFATPVTITAGTTYVASYHTNTGEYSADPSLFANAVATGPLTAPSSASSGGNGVYAYGGSSLFPTNSFNATSYGVDVLFKPQLAG
jgi:hypothetical protein